MNLFKQNPTKKLVLFSLALIIIGFTVIQFVAVKEANASTACANATVYVIARDQNGAVIPGIAYEILEAAANSDDQVRPGRKVSSGKIDAVLGQGKSIFAPTNENYVVKMYDKNPNYGAFYFYNELTLACGEEKTFTGVLSGIEIELRDSNGTLKKNTAFAISQQTYNANGERIKQKGALIASLNSELSDRKIIYLADDSHTLDQSSVRYVFSAAAYGGAEFALYDISPNNGKTRDINYVFSDISIKFKDKNKNILPAGTKVEFLTQKSDSQGRVIADKLIKVLSVDSYGYVQFEYPAGYYFLRIKKAGGDYNNFTDIKIDDQARTSLILDVPDSSTDQAACAANSTLNVVARKASGGYIPGIKFELYEKVSDANNLPAAGKIAAKGATNSSGNGSVSFKPNSGKAYILKMYEKNANLGAFWYYGDIKFACGETKNITKNLSGIALIARDASGSLLKNYGFSLYLQKRDIDNNIVKAKEFLVADARTDALGQAAVYVNGGNPADYQDTARYLISIRSGNGMIFDQADIGLAIGADTQVNFALSGLNLSMIDAANKSLAKGTGVEVYEQKTDLNNKKILGKRVIRLALDDYGKAVAALPAGAYALSLKDKGGNAMNYWDIKIENGLLNSKNITTPLLRVYASNAEGKSLSKADINVYSLTKNSEGEYQKNKSIYRVNTAYAKYTDIFLATGRYLITVKQGVSEFGATVEINNSGLKKVYLSTKVANLIKPESVYRIATVNSDVAAAGNNVSFSSALANRLKGYVLLQVEANGEAWYLNPKDKKRYYLQDGAASFETMRRLGLGVSNSDLSKIPVGVLPVNGEVDCDSDGLADSLERAIGTQVCDNDSDSDGYNDGEEVLHNYQPLGSGKLTIDKKLADRLSGSLLLQVESKVEIWYLNPKDKKRYYIPDNDAGFKIMKYLSLGITNANLDLIETAE